MQKDQIKAILSGPDAQCNMHFQWNTFIDFIQNCFVNFVWIWVRKAGAGKIQSSVPVSKVNVPRFTLENDKPDPWNCMERYGVAIRKIVMPVGTTSWSIWRSMDMRPAPEHTPDEWWFELFYDDVVYCFMMMFHGDLMKSPNCSSWHLQHSRIHHFTFVS